MELYLDSVDLSEVEEAMKLGIIAGLTTTPTFLHREGIKDVDQALLKLGQQVPILQVEALGSGADEIVAEAERLVALGLDKTKTVFKIPISNEGIIACGRLRAKDMMVNLHLVYNLQQAYMAMLAGATYICPLVGRLQDQGHDALALVEQCVETTNFYGYDSKIMFSSVRHPEHVRNAINLGVDACTIPWKVMKGLTENNFTRLGTEQFVEHTKLITMKVKDIVRASSPFVNVTDTVADAIVKMTETKLGAVCVLEADGSLKGIFTDGDLRRNLGDNGKAIMEKPMSSFDYGTPITIEAEQALIEAVAIFKSRSVDNLIVLNDGKPVAMLDVQDLVKMNLFG